MAMVMMAALATSRMVMVVFVEAVVEAEASGCGSVEKEVGTVW